MTQPSNLGATIGEWMGQTATRRAPHDTLEAVLDQTRSTRPLPRWRAMIVVPHMRRESTILVGSPVIRRLVAVVAITLAVLAATLALAGAALLRGPLSEVQVFVYAANPVSLPAEFCEGGRDCRNALAAWPGGRFLLMQRLYASAAPTVAVEAPWPSTIVDHRLSPTGAYVAYVRTQRGFPATCLQLVVVDLRTGAEHLVAEDPGDLEAAGWSGPDADRLMFATGGRCSPRGPGVFVYDAATGTLARVLDLRTLVGQTTEPRFGSDPVIVHAFHPDRGRVLVTVDHRFERSDTLIVSIDAISGPPAELACDCSVAGAAWSPDGSRLLVETTFGELKIGGGDGSGLRTIPGLASQATWSPDGASIAYLGEPTGRGFGSDDRAVFVVSADGGEPVRLGTARFPNPSLGTTPRWSPDGSQIYWSDAEGTWAIRPDGSDLRILDLPAQIDLRWVTIEDADASVG